MTIKDVKLAIEELDKEATLVNEELINQKLNMFSQGVIDDLELMEFVRSNRRSWGWDNAYILSGIINRMSKSLFEDKHIFTRIIEIAHPLNIGDIYRRSNGMYNNDRSLMLEILTKSPSTIEKVNSTLLFDEEFIKQAILKEHEEMNDVVKIDSSLAAMQFMLVARAHGYDTNPIGGFEADKLAEAFGLKKDRYVPVMILSIGKALEEGYNSIRLDAKEFTTFK